MPKDGAWPSELVAAARGGENGALETLMERSWPHAYRIALSIVRDRVVAQDTAQEACAAAFRAIASLRSEDAFGLWFYRIVVREALAMERRRKPVASLDEVPPSASPLTSSVVRLDVLNALVQLPPQQRAVVALHYYADLNSFEIADILGIADSSVRFHLMQARRRLERLLSDHREAPLRSVVHDAR